MPQEHGRLSCRPKAAFGAGEMLLKCLLQQVAWLFLCMGFLFLCLEGEVCEWKGVNAIRCAWLGETSPRDWCSAASKFNQWF